MKEYEFTLTFTLLETDADPQVYVDRLMEAGCDDALIGVGVLGRIALDFIRTSDSAVNAITSAIENVLSAIPNAKFIECSPDLVGISGIAAILQVSRQAVQKMVNKHVMTFPAPVHSGTAPIWHLATVLTWITTNTSHHKVDQPLIEIAAVARKINLVKEVSDLEESIPHKISSLFPTSRQSLKLH